MTLPRHTSRHRTVLDLTQQANVIELRGQNVLALKGLPCLCNGAPRCTKCAGRGFNYMPLPPSFFERVRIYNYDYDNMTFTLESNQKATKVLRYIHNGEEEVNFTQNNNVVTLTGDFNPKEIFLTDITNSNEITLNYTELSKTDGDATTKPYITLPIADFEIKTSIGYKYNYIYKINSINGSSDNIPDCNWINNRIFFPLNYDFDSVSSINISLLKTQKWALIKANTETKRDLKIDISQGTATLICASEFRLDKNDLIYALDQEKRIVTTKELGASTTEIEIPYYPFIRLYYVKKDEEFKLINENDYTIIDYNRVRITNTDVLNFINTAGTYQFEYSSIYKYRIFNKIKPIRTSESKRGQERFIIKEFTDINDNQFIQGMQKNIIKGEFS